MKKEGKLENEALREIAPTLANMEKKSPFRAPVDYFETLPSAIQARILEERAPQFTFTLLLRKGLVTALGVAVVALIGYWLLGFDQIQPSTLNLDLSEIQITEEDVLLIDDALLYSYYEDHYIDNGGLVEADDELLKYLVEEDYPIEDLLKEL